MERLWAPWRMAFVEKEKGKPEGCIFCRFPEETGDEADRQNLVLGRTALSFAMVNLFPYTTGHLLVLPRRHTGEFEALTPDEVTDLNLLLQRSIVLLKQAYKPDALNVGLNLGKAAGGSISDHLHWHVVPRWTGDTSFMPVVGDTRVMIERPDQTWARLRPLFTPPA